MTDPAARGALCDRVDQLCSAGTDHGDPILAELIAPVTAMLAGPLRVAVAGRVNAGKSTLVNALLERRIAPTKTTECTQFATWYQYDHSERVVVRLKDGRTLPLPLTGDGGLPDRVGVPPADVDRLDVFLSQAVLRDMTIIDTPGLASLNEENSDRAEDLLTRSTEASQRAEAVLFVFAVSLKADERDILRDFHDSSASVAGHSPVNALGVLSKVDILTDPDEDPWPVAERLAADFGARLAHEVAGVVPVTALIAETIAAGAFTEADAATLAALAAMERRPLRRLLRSVDAFVSDEAPVPADARRALRDRLDLYGIAVALEDLAAGARGAVDLGTALLERSRLRVVRDALVVSFAYRSDAIKASWALAQLDRITHAEGLDPGVRQWFADRVEETRLDPAMHRVAVIQALNDVAVGTAELPTELADALTRLADGATPGERVGLAPTVGAAQISARARELGSEFATYAFDAFP